MSSSATGLTKEQKLLAERNRLEALERRRKLENDRSRNPALFPQAVPSVSHREKTESHVPVPLRSAFVGSQSKMKTSALHAKSRVQVECTLISRERFNVTCGYDAQLIALFKTISSSRYDMKTKSWTFHISDHDSFVKQVKALPCVQKLDPVPLQVLNLFKNSPTMPAIPDVNLDVVDPFLRQNLFPFQVTGVCFAISKNGRCLIADDMGLGKTIQALAIACYYRTEWPLLIIAPSSVRYAWKQAICRWLPSVEPESINVMDSAKDEIGDCSVYILSYELMVRSEAAMAQKKFQVIISDESHMLKNFKAARTRAILPMLKIAKRAILLSGTPALSRPAELYTQISSVNPQAFPSFHTFGVRYCNGKQSVFGWDFNGASNTTELVLLLEEQVMIRRLKSEVIKELPPKSREMVLLDPTSIKNRTKEMATAAEILNDQRVVGIERRGCLLSYYAATASVKIRAVNAYIADLLEGEKKFICFAHHRCMLDGISSELERKNHKYIRIDGSTSSEARKHLCDKFQLNDDYRVALLSITAASTGITLTAAHLVLFAELFWNPGILTQAEDRAHRIGQADSVLVQYLVARGTADDYLWPLVQKKLDILNKAGLSKDNFMDADTITSELTDPCQSTIGMFFEVTSEDQLLKDINWDELSPEDFDLSSPKRKKHMLRCDNLHS